MSAAVCRVCLVNNLNLYSVRNDLQAAFESMTGVEYNKSGYPLSMCYICVSVLRRCHRFMVTARDTNNMLEEWYGQKVQELVAKPLNSYSMTKPEVMSVGTDTVLLENEIKMEVLDEELESDYKEYDTDMNNYVEKLETDDQPNSDFVLDSSYIDQTTDDQDQDQTDHLFNSYMNIDKRSRSSIVDNDTNIERKKIKLQDNRSGTKDGDEDLDKILKKVQKDFESADSIQEFNALDNFRQDIEEINSFRQDVQDLRRLCDEVRHRQKDNGVKTWDVPLERESYEMNECRGHQNQDIIIEDIQEIDSQTELRFLSSNNIPNDLNTVIKIEQIDENDSEVFNTDNIYLTEVSTVINEKNSLSKSKYKELHICELCDKPLSSTWSLNRHIKRKHESKTNKNKTQKNQAYSCNECSYKCDSKRTFLVHNKLHKKYVFTCNICEYKCISKSNLNRHLKSHTGEKPFACDTCDVKCTTKRGLELHMRIHAGIKPFSCDFCDLKCVTSSDLTKHLRIHTGEKPYWCDECGYKCKRLYHLKIHMNKHK